MNIRIFAFLPLSLLLSTTAYSMDIEEVTTTLTLPTTATTTTTIVLTPEHSVILPQSQTPVKETIVTVAQVPITVQSKRLGIMTGLKDRIWGESSTVAHEIAQGQFDSTIPANRRRLSKALEQETQTQSPENLKQLKKILEDCSIKEIDIDDITTLQLIRQYSHTLRTQKEKSLIAEATVALQNADKKRSALVADLQKIFIEVIEKANAIDNNLTIELDEANKKHGGTILLGTEVKRLTRRVNKHIPADDYDSDTESNTYDRQFNERKLDLYLPIVANHKLNKRVAENLSTLEGIVELADKQTIKAHAEQNS